MTYRDDELGAALSALPTPEHAPGFFEELDVRLRRETPGLGARRPSRRLGRAAAALAAAFVLCAVVALSLGDRVLDLGTTDVASAAEVKATVRVSLGSMETLGAVLVSGCTERGCPGKSGERRWRFLLTARGDLRLVGPTDAEVVIYDASAGIVRSAQRSASLGGGPVFYTERRGVAPGPPDAGRPTLHLLDEFAAFVRALLAAPAARVREVVYDGRPAWRLEVEATPSAIVPQFTGDRFEVVVDRETGMPVRVVELKGEAVLRDLHIEGLAVDSGVPAGAFDVRFPEGAEVPRMDDGFRRVGLDDVRAEVGYAPLVPAFVPDGFELTEVAVADLAGPTGAEAGNPPSHEVVSLSYRRGFDQLVVTTRLARVPGAVNARWSDPLATGEGYPDAPERVVLAEGALAGERADVLVVPRGVPHLWTEAEGLVVTVAGSLSRADLVRVAESLERQR